MFDDPVLCGACVVFCAALNVRLVEEIQRTRAVEVGGVIVSCVKATTASFMWKETFLFPFFSFFLMTMYLYCGEPKNV